MVKNNFENMFLNLEKDILNNQKKVNNNSMIKVYYGLTKDGFQRLSFLSRIKPPKIESTKMLKVTQGEEGEGNYWTCFDLLNTEFKKIFYLFCDDLVNTLNGINDESKELNIIKERFSIWKIMFKKVSNSLSSEKEQGLYGELYFLDNYMIEKYGVDEAINSWAGPLGYNKDFSINDKWYEIKATSVNSSSVKISSLNQLSSDIIGFLVLVRIEKMSEEFNEEKCSILDLFNSIINKITDNETKETFINKVLEYGFNPETDFQKNKYSVDKVVLYEVKDGFPRLTEKDIKYQEIDNVTYEIIIRTIEKYKVEEI
jgi:hypothetical protein